MQYQVELSLKKHVSTFTSGFIFVTSGFFLIWTCSVMWFARDRSRDRFSGPLIGREQKLLSGRHLGYANEQILHNFPAI